LGLKKGPRGDSRHSRWATLIKDPPFFDRSPPYGPKSAPKAPKSAPRAPQEGSKRPQEAPKRPPTGSQEPPKRPQEAPKMAQDGSKSEKARKQNTLIFHRFWKGFGFSGGPRGDSRHSRGAGLIKAPPFFDTSPPRWPQKRPEGSQERPKNTLLKMEFSPQRRAHSF